MQRIMLSCLFSGMLVASSVIAANQVVVVPLNSTKISKQQTLIYNAFAMQQIGGDHINFRNGCAANSTDVGAIILPLTLPLGAKLVSIKTYALDSGSSGLYFNIFLTRNNINLGSSKVTFSTLASANGGASNTDTIVELDLSPSVSETVDDGETFYLNFQSNGTNANGFCGAQVTIELP